jgi:trans-aconitate methyltransferase
MAFAGLPDDAGSRSMAGHTFSGARDRRGRRPRQGGPIPSLTLNRPAGDVESPGSAHEAADYLQAEYFLRLLAQNRRHIDHRIAEYQKAIAAAQAAGDTEGAATLRRMEHAEEQDRQTLEDLIQNLRRRFPVRAPGEVPQVPRGARLVVR